MSCVRLLENPVLPRVIPNIRMPALPPMAVVRPPHMTRVQDECGGLQVPMVVIIVSRIRSSFVWIGPGLLQPAGGLPGGHAPTRTRKSPSGFPFG